MGILKNKNVWVEILPVGRGHHHGSADNPWHYIVHGIAIIMAAWLLM